jgi:hypothetical protein
MYIQRSMAKRDRSIRVPVTSAELRSAQKVAKDLDMPIAILLRKFLRETAERKK